MFDYLATTLTSEEIRLGESFRSALLEAGLKLPTSIDETDNVRTETKPYAMSISILMRDKSIEPKVMDVYTAWASQNFPSKTWEELNNDGLLIVLMEPIRVSAVTA